MNNIISAKPVSQICCFLVLIFSIINPGISSGEPKFRRPFNIVPRITAHVDHEPINCDGSFGCSPPMWDDNDPEGTNCCYLHNCCKDFSLGALAYDRHTGTDYGLNLDTGRPFDIVAAANGIYTSSKNDCRVGDTYCGGGFGNYVFIKHSENLYSLYGHLEQNSITFYQNQQYIHCGEKIGISGRTGYATGVHLHFELRTPPTPRGGFRADLDPYCSSALNNDAMPEYCNQPSKWVEIEQNGHPTLSCDPTPSACLDSNNAPIGNTGLFKNGWDSEKSPIFINTFNIFKTNIGCPQSNSNDPFDIFVHSSNGVLIQDFYQQNQQLRFSGSDGWSALVYNSTSNQSYLLRSGFWGAYKCLRLEDQDFAGPIILGAPVNNEYVTEAPENLPKQDFERGYMTWQPQQQTLRIHLYEHDPDLINWNAVSTCVGTVTIDNPPVAPPVQVDPRVTVSPVAGPSNTLFIQNGMNFTPNSEVILYFRDPQGTLLTPIRKQTDGFGSYNHSYRSTNQNRLGVYSYWATDEHTGMVSNTFQYRITGCGDFICNNNENRNTCSQDCATIYTEGRSYKGTDGPDVCRYMGGRCYILDSEPIYYYFYPNDFYGNLIQTISQSEFNLLKATSPCVIGGSYTSNIEPGCIHFDSSLESPSQYFIKIGNETRRMTQSAATSCFNSERIVHVPGLNQVNEVFNFIDSTEEPYYCNPSESTIRRNCGLCAEQTVSCNPSSCLRSTSSCTSTCTGGETCIDNQCQFEEPLLAGQILSPNDGVSVSNQGFVLTWRNGSARDGSDTGTAPFCRINGGAWVSQRGFGSATSTNIGNLPLGAQLECRVRTRLDNDHNIWIDSSSVFYRASTNYAQMTVENITLLPTPFGGCDELEFVATIRNIGEQAGSWQARAYLHPAGETEGNPEAIEAQRYETVSLAPGERAMYQFSIQPAGPLSLNTGQHEVTVIVDDVYQQIGLPSRETISVFGVDEESPTIEVFEVYGYPGTPTEVLPGLSHLVRMVASDDYAVEDWELAWRPINGTWQTINTADVFDASCPETYGSSTYWAVSSQLPSNQTLEVRFRIWDLVGNMTEQVKQVKTRSNAQPSVNFIQPVAGSRYYESDSFSEDCVPLDFQVIPGVPIGSISVGFANLDASQKNHRQSFSLTQNHRYTTCLTTTNAGDQIRVYVQLEDTNHQYHLFLSNPITVDLPPPQTPWNAIQVEPTQQALPIFNGYTPTTTYNQIRESSNTFSLVRRDERRWNDTNGYIEELSAKEIVFNKTTLAHSNTQIILNPVMQNENSTHRFYYLNNSFNRFTSNSILFGAYTLNSGCSQNCNFDLFVRETSQGALLSATSIKNYFVQQDLRAPRYAHHLLSPSNAWLLGVLSWTGSTYYTDLFKKSNNSWVLMGTVPYNLSSQRMFVKNNQLWGISSESVNTNQRRLIYYNINENSASTSNIREITTLSSTNFSFLTAYENIGNGVYVAAISENVFYTYEFDGSNWIARQSSTLPVTWRGETVTQWTLLENPFIASGTLYVPFQIRTQNSNVMKIVVPIKPTVTIDWESTLLIDSSERQFTVLSDGRRLQTFTCSWNLETRLCFQIAPVDSIACFDDNLCTNDRWDSNTRRCVFDPVVCTQDGDLCNGPEVCNPTDGQCGTDAVQQVVCNDGQACNGTEVCISSTGTCQSGSSIIVSDNFICTIDTCNEMSGQVTHVENGDLCVPNACQTAICDPEAISADQTSGCVFTERPAVPDGLTCTVDRCDPDTGRPLYELQSGFCLIDTVCYAAGARNSNNPCLACDPETSPIRWSEQDSGSCDDGLFCTVDDVCQAGQCQGTPKICPTTNNYCERSLCREATDRCETVLSVNFATCEDDNLCNGREYCLNGSCQPGEPLELDGSNPCVALTCDPEQGLIEQPQNGACDDLDPCTTSDECTNGQCQGIPYTCIEPGECEVFDGAICLGDGTCQYQFVAENTTCANEQGVCRSGICKIQPQLINLIGQASAEGENINLQLEVNDADSDSFTFEANGLPPALSIHPTRGSISGVVDEGASVNSPYWVTISISDGDFTVEYPIVWVINASQDIVANIFADDIVDEGSTIRLEVRTEPQGITTTVQWDLNDDGLFDDASGQLLNWAAPDGPQSWSIAAEVRGGASPIQVSDTVEVRNVPPVIQSTPPALALVGNPYQYSVEASDPTDEVSYTLVTGLTGMSFVDDDGDGGDDELMFNPLEEHLGMHQITVRVSDDDGGSTEQTWPLTVANSDEDGDSVDDACELRYGLNPNDPNDADEDADGDGLTNRMECALGTNPVEANQLPTPRLLSPISNEGTIPRLSLSESNSQITFEIEKIEEPLWRYVEYVVEIDDTDNFSNPLYSQAINNEQQSILWISDGPWQENIHYFWRAKTQIGPASSDWSSSEHFLIDTANEPPGVPYLISPLDAEDTVTPTFTVGEVEDPEGDDIIYKYEIIQNGATVMSDESSDTSIIFDSPLQTNQTYEWRAKAIDSLGEASDWSNKESFSINTDNKLPQAPVILFPQADQIVTTPGVEVQFQRAEDSDSAIIYHEIQLAEDEAFQAIVFEKLDIDNTSNIIGVAIDNFQENKDYHVRVRGRDDVGPGDYASVHFIINAISEPPSGLELIAPLNGETIDTEKVVLRFRGSIDPEGGPVSHIISIFKNPELTEPLSPQPFTQPIVLGANNEGEVELDVQLLSGQYHWLVTATDQDGLTTSTPSRAFTILTTSTEIPSGSDCTCTITKPSQYKYWLILGMLSLVALAVRRKMH